MGTAGDPCSYAPRVAGVGTARLERWTYNSFAGRCDLFIYHGQKGNQNNFMSQEECAEKCIGRDTVIAAPTMDPPKFENPCSTGFPLVSAQNEILQCMESRPCPRGYYCHIGGNDITTVCCPAIGSDPCGQPLDSGTGGMRLQRWYWNAQAGCCQMFNYCGLRGTQNNFLSREDCEQTCMEYDSPCAGGQPEMLSPNRPKQCGLFNSCSPNYWCHMGAKPQTTVCCPNRVPPAQVCRLPMVCGRGNANLQRWYYDVNRGCCVMFVYNGKYGNQNNFLTLQDCQKACVDQTNKNQLQIITPLPQITTPNSLISTTPIPWKNHCPQGEPLLEKLVTQNGTTLAIRPIKCTYENDREVCGEAHWCFLGVTADENMCCSGESRQESACSGMALLDSGAVYEGEKPVLRWMYDVKTNECFAFGFKGSKGNQNNFLTEEECLAMCQAINPCKLPVPLPLEQCIPGPNACAARPNMYCHVGAVPQTTVCCPAETPNPCELPLDPGLGRDKLERWFYNAQSAICQPFTYNGIKGNQNNFLSQLECEELCVPNPCAEGRPFVGADGRPQTCSPSASMNTCPADHWCHVGATPVTTVCCPAARPNPCNLPMSTGEGDASLERWYYEPASKTCKPFEYRGLKGNQNNYLSQRACQLACQPLDNPCIGQPATTPSGQVLFCSATNKDTCPVNFWCHLGSTPETTVCCPGATNPCSVPLAPGTGNSGLSRWYYNTDERQCIPFQYNGKRGNQNNFLSQTECERTCPEQLCLLSIDKGACSGRQTRFAFNRQTSQCVPFEYTGCGGNLNNFLTMEDCVATCGNVGF